MKLYPRAYNGDDDLRRMMQLLSDCQQMPQGFYIHPGDLNWWVYYNPSDIDVTEKATLWEDAGGELQAWSYASPEWSDFDYFVRPAIRGTDSEGYLLDWVEASLRLSVHRYGGEKRKNGRIATSAAENERDRIALLQARGYQPEPFLTLFTYKLRAIPQSKLPDGYTFLERMHEDWAEQRADVHRHAFINSRMTADYYRAFMRAPLYDPSLDTVVVGPDGRFGAFAMVWVDEASGIGAFEPVGTRKEWQRRGLGRAVMLEGLRRMVDRGVHTAYVLTHSEDAGNIAFYQACGFHISNRVLRFCKPLGAQ